MKPVYTLLWRIANMFSWMAEKCDDIADVIDDVAVNLEYRSRR
jgi:hypothetical protein